jgi:hypothetical protein
VNSPEPCNSGVAATFRNVATGEETTLSVMCQGLLGHSGRHFHLEAGSWSDDDIEPRP